MTTNQAAEGHEFHIRKSDREGFLKQVSEIAQGEFLVAERAAGENLYIRIFPASSKPGTGEQFANLASDVSLHAMQVGAADKEMDF